MAEKIQITNISSVGIICRALYPNQLFLEVKDDGHPIKLVRRQLCLIGGNWLGEAAKNDRGPLDTFRRELQEELSFQRPIRNSIELHALGQSDVQEFAPTPIAAEATPADKAALTRLKKTIGEAANPSDDYLITIPKEVLDTADPENTRDGITTLSCYHWIPLEEREWATLTRLQEKFKNLSNESITLMTSLEEIVQTGTKTAFGHDWALKRTFLTALENWGGSQYEPARHFPIVPGIQSIRMGPSLPTYKDYLKCYEVARKP